MKKYLDIMSVIARAGGAHIHAIVLHTGLTQPQVSAVLRELKREGYVYREKRIWYVTERAIVDLSDVVTEYSYWSGK